MHFSSLYSSLVSLATMKAEKEDEGMGSRGGGAEPIASNNTYTLAIIGSQVLIFIVMS